MVYTTSTVLATDFHFMRRAVCSMLFDYHHLEEQENGVEAQITDDAVFISYTEIIDITIRNFKITCTYKIDISN